MTDQQSENIDIITTNYKEEQRSRPTVTPTLVFGLGGTGVNTLRHLKRRLVWLWNRQMIDEELAKIPSDLEPTEWRIWQKDVWQRFEMDGGLPLVQLLAVDTCPWENPPGKTWLNHREYAYIGGFNASEVLKHKRDHKEIDEWWKWDDESSRPGQIHSGARQIRPIGRLSFYRRYREFYQKLERMSDAVTQIQNIQYVEDRGISVIREGTKHIYIVTSICGGTGAGIYLDVAARLRYEYGESAIITGIFALPSVFILDLRSDLQKRRVQANTYASLKEINYFQSHKMESIWLPGEEKHPVERMFDRIYLVERTNKNDESLNSVDDVTRLIANQIYMESLTQVGSRVWELDVNVTSENKKQAGQIIHYSYSSFANSSLGVPRDEMYDYLELCYAEELIKRLLRGGLSIQPGQETTFSAAIDARDETLIQGKARQAFTNLETMIGKLSQQTVLGISSDEEGEDEDEDEDAPGLPEVSQTPGHSQISATGALETLMQALTVILSEYGLGGGWVFIRHLLLDLNAQADRSRGECINNTDTAKNCQERLDHLLASRPSFLGRMRFFPFTLFNSAELRSRQNRINDARDSLDRAKLEETTSQAKLENWQRLIQNLAPIEKDLLERAKQMADLRANQIKNAKNRVFDDRTAAVGSFEMFTPLLGRKYIEDNLYKAVLDQGLRKNLAQDTSNLSGNSAIFGLYIGLQTIKAAGSETFPSAIMLSPSSSQKIFTSILARARRSVRDTLKPAQLDLRQIIDSRNTDVQVRLRDLFVRCQPFWKINLDRGGITENDLEEICLVGLDAKDSWGHLLGDFEFYERVETHDPSRIDACRVVHGLPIQFLASLEAMKSQYEYFLNNTSGPLQLSQAWEPGEKRALPELIGDPLQRSPLDEAQPSAPPPHQQKEPPVETQDEQTTPDLTQPDLTPPDSTTKPVRPPNKRRRIA